MKKTIIRCISVMIAVVTLVLLSVPVYASTYMDSHTEITGAFWWKKTLKYDDYYDFDCELYMPDQLLTEMMRHNYVPTPPNSSPWVDISLHLNKGYTKTFSGAKSWNKNIGINIGDKDIGIAVSKGHGTSLSVSYSISQSQGYTKNVMNFSPAGTYFLAPGMYVSRCHSDKKELNSNGTWSNTLESTVYYVPTTGIGYIGSYYIPLTGGGAYSW